MPDYFSGWEKEVFVCPECKWVGMGTKCEQGEMFKDLFELDCPSCSRTLTVVTYPTLEECKQNLDRLSEDDQIQLKAREQFLESALSAELVSVDQLPDLEGDEIVLAWDQDKNGMTVIRYGSVDVWREVAYYEGYSRFCDVLKLLSEKYGDRFIDLAPTIRSMNMLYGDSLSSPRTVDQARSASARYWGGEPSRLPVRTPDEKGFGPAPMPTRIR